MGKKKQGKKSPKPKARKERPAEAPVDPNPQPPEGLKEEGRRRESPKRTGRRGPRPLDPADDFQQPTKAGEPLFPEKAAKKPRQARLPQMDDPQIEELEAAAEQYASIRDERIALNQDEHKLKEELLGLMKKNSKERYHRDGIEVRLVHEQETVKVKISKGHDEE